MIKHIVDKSHMCVSTMLVHIMVICIRKHLQLNHIWWQQARSTWSSAAQNDHRIGPSYGTRQSRVSSSFSMGDMRKAANRKRFCWRRGGGAQAVLVHPKSCRFHEHGASRQAPPKIKIFYLFVSGSGSRVGFNQSENWLLTTTCNISLMKISVNPTGIPGVVWSIKISEI